MTRTNANKRQGRCGHLLRTLAVTVPLALSTAGALTITTSIIDAQPAAAWGLGDIKNAAKKVGGAVKKGGKAVGKVAKGTANAGLGVAAEVSKTVGVGIPRTILKGVGKYDDRMAEYMAEKELAIDKNLNVDGIARAGKKVGKVIIGKNKIGESFPRRDKSKAENALADYMNRRGTTTRKGTSYRGPSGTLKPGIVRDRKFHGGSSTVILKPGIVKNKPSRGDYTGGYREKIGNDKSVMGRPIYRNQRPQGEKQQIGNTKSIDGRPVYGKRPGKPNRKVQGIRLGDIKSGAKRTRDLRKKNRKFSKDRRFKRDRKRFSESRKLKRDRKRLSRDRKFKRNKRLTRNKRFERNNRKRMSRKARNNRKSRGFRMKRNRNRGGNNRRRNNRRNR